MKRVYVVDGLDPSGKVFAVEARPATQDAVSSPSTTSSSSSSSAAGSSSTSWSVGEMAMNVSVTSSSTVVVTCGRAAQLREFTHDGELLRQIALDPELVGAQHAVQLPPPAASAVPADDDRFVVCHGWMDDALHRVCVVDAAAGGPPTHVYGRQRGSASTNSLHNASHIAVDAPRQCVFVVDMGNRRVVAFDAALQLVADVPVKDKKRLPSRICLDDERATLYVACNEWKDVFWTSGSVNVFRVSHK